MRAFIQLFLCISLFGCLENRKTYQFGEMAGPYDFCHMSQLDSVNCFPDITDISNMSQEELIGRVKWLTKKKHYQLAEDLLNASIRKSNDGQTLERLLVEVYIRQQKWLAAESVINKLGVPVNDPIRLTIEARTGHFSEGTDINKLPQIYRNKINNVSSLRANVRTDYLTYFELTRVDNAQSGALSMEPSIKVSDDGQNILVAWMEHINFPETFPNILQKGRSAFSSDGGETWTTQNVGTDNEELDFMDLDLITAYDPDNNLMYISGITWPVGFQTSLEESLFTYRIDLSTGNRVGPFIVQGDDPPPNLVVTYDKTLMAIDSEGGIYLTSYAPGQVKFSSDFGQTFSDLSGVPDGMSQPRVKNDCLYLVSQTSPRFWRCDYENTLGIVTPASDNWWGYYNQVSGEFQVHNLSYMAFHPGGDIYILFSELKEVGSDELAIWMSRSTDNGDSWEDAWIVTPDISGDKFLPWIEIDSEGGIHISYADTRNNIQPDSSTTAYIDMYYSYSADGGQNWLESRVTPSSLELIYGVSYDFTYSDYNEMAVADSDTVFLSFPWSETADMDMYVAKKYKKTDLIYKHGFEPSLE